MATTGISTLSAISTRSSFGIYTASDFVVEPNTAPVPI